MTRASSTSDIKLWLYCLSNAFGTPNRLTTPIAPARCRQEIVAFDDAHASVGP